MIVSIESSIPTFKVVRFHAGLNVLLADTRPGATEKQTRNSAGKTSLVEIIHFLLGANCNKDSLFRIDALIKHSFTGTFTIAGARIAVSRSGSDPSKIFVLGDSEPPPGLATKIDRTTGQSYISNTNWKKYLGHAMFKLPEIAQDSDDDQTGSVIVAVAFQALKYFVLILHCFELYLSNSAALASSSTTAIFPMVLMKDRWHTR